MKNLNLCKRALAFLTVAGITLLSGCAESAQKGKKTVDDLWCTHAIIRFGDQYVIFRECDGFEISTRSGKGTSGYYIYQDDLKEPIISGGTTDLNICNVTDHTVIDPIEEKAIEEGAIVYQKVK